jgi:hypothetical protein
MSETWLTPEEVGELTQTQPNSWAAQRRKLARMGVPFTPNAAGRPLVERAVVLKHQAKPKAAKEPKWSAIRGKAA